MNERQRVELRPGAYHDSVTLLQVSRTVAAVDGVLAAQVAMATDLNLDVLARMGFDVPDGAGPNDLVVAVRAVGDEALQAADAALARALSPGGGPAASGTGPGSGEAVPPRTTRSAARRLAAADEAAGIDRPRLALVSVPGEHAFAEALDALDAGLDVLVFSDNVPVEQEVRLKAEAAERGLLVMGPDCGTAVVSGVGLGFANVVRPGPVSLVAASGTGAQQVMSLLDGAGVGVRHCLGVGGRDLSAAVGGASARQALRMLDDDPGTELILVVSKPPAPQVAAELEALAAALATPVRFALLGPGAPDLTEASRGVVEALGLPWSPPRSWTSGSETAPLRGAVLRGAFAGGTLCDEAMVIASAALGPIASNIPLDGAPRLADPLAAVPVEDAALRHAMVDFGDDELTRGRPHPMIDGTLRAEWIVAQAKSAAEHGSSLVLLLDVVLGHGAAPDPAADLVPALAEAATVAGDVGFAAVVSLCGTEGDPQGLERQAEALVEAGARVYLSNAEAAREAVRSVGAATLVSRAVVTDAGRR